MNAGQLLFVTRGDAAAAVARVPAHRGKDGADEVLCVVKRKPGHDCVRRVADDVEVEAHLGAVVAVVPLSGALHL